MRTLRATCIGLLAIAFSSAAAIGQTADLEEASRLGLEPLALSEVQDPLLTSLLGALADQTGILPREDHALTSAATPGILIVPLQKPNDPDTQIFLLYEAQESRYFFLQIAAPYQGRDVRLWSRGEPEILFTAEGARLVPRPSPTTFRIDDSAAYALASRGAVTELLTAGEAIDCIARTLGVSVNPATFIRLLSSASCSAVNTIALALVAVSCGTGAIPSCVLGIAKLIACGITNCTTTSPGTCEQAITVGQTVFGTWTSTCDARHRPGAYAKYYTFTLTSTTRLRIDLASLIRNPYLYILDADGQVFGSDDDGGPFWNSRVTETFPPGTYTIEATTYSAGASGPFAVSLRRR